MTPAGYIQLSSSCGSCVTRTVRCCTACCLSTWLPRWWKVGCLADTSRPRRLAASVRWSSSKPLGWRSSWRVFRLGLVQNQVQCQKTRTKVGLRKGSVRSQNCALLQFLLLSNMAGSGEIDRSLRGAQRRDGSCHRQAFETGVDKQSRTDSVWERKTRRRRGHLAT